MYIALKLVEFEYNRHHEILNIMVIEEPEAHLFPSTQKTFIYSLVEMLNGRKNHACFIATHSPYIMTSFNNVILAGEASKESVEKSDAVGRLIPRQQTLTFDEVAAFEINNGSIRSIMDDEFRLISADAIDSSFIQYLYKGCSPYNHDDTKGENGVSQEIQI